MLSRPSVPVRPKYSMRSSSESSNSSSVNVFGLSAPLFRGRDLARKQVPAKTAHKEVYSYRAPGSQGLAELLALLPRPCCRPKLQWGQGEGPLCWDSLQAGRNRFRPLPAADVPSMAHLHTVNPLLEATSHAARASPETSILPWLFRMGVESRH